MTKALLRLFFAAVLAILLALSVSAEEGDKYTIVLDPGHGGHDPGTTVGTRYESEYNYDVALLLKERLEAHGSFEVILTRGRNEYKNYLHRALVAEKADADILISLHFNSNSALDPTLNGVEVLASVLDEWSPDYLANGILTSVSKKCGLRNGGIKKERDTGDSRGVYYWNEEIGWDVPGVKTARVSDYYSMISWGTKLGFPAIIIEHAYLSNRSDLAFCDSKDGLRLLAEADAEAIIAYYTGHTHEFESSVDRRANCCLEGISSVRCTLCGYRKSVTRTPSDPAVHAWTTDSRQVTCTSDGYVKRECQISRNLSEKGLDYIAVHRETEVISSTGHAMVTQVDTAASHGTDGIFRQVCSTCGWVYEKVTPGDPHIYERLSMTEATCTSDGTEVFECTICGDTYENVTSATGHDYVSGNEPLTCASDGTKEYTCTLCGDVISEGVEVPPHKTELKIDRVPTCEEDGLRRMVCTVCGYTEDQVIAKTGHAFDEGKTVTEADYFAEGLIKFTCKNDKSHIKEEIIPKKPGGEMIIVGASAGCVLLLGLIVMPFIILGRKRLRRISEESAETLEAVETESEKEVSEKETV